MADHCVFCDTRRPDGGTQIIVTNGGNAWFEFCPPCGELETIKNADTGEEITVAELFRRNGGTPTPANPERVATIRRYREEAKEMAAAWREEQRIEEEKQRLLQEKATAARRTRLRGGLNGGKTLIPGVTVVATASKEQHKQGS